MKVLNPYDRYAVSDQGCDGARIDHVKKQIADGMGAKDDDRIIASPPIQRVSGGLAGESVVSRSTVQDVQVQSALK